jgi:single-stranded-DNA-specific exonuclease
VYPVPRVKKVWHVLPHDTAATDRLAGELRVSPVVAQLLLNRGVRDAEAGRRFLEPALTALHPPELLPGVPDATDRIVAAVRAGRKVCVYGDYDVDGVTGTAILVRLIELLGGTVQFYVPHRLEEGYGLNLEALRQLKRGGAELVVTVDCGITASDEAVEARRLGVELVVTDHHELADTVPAADAVVHPRLPGSAYPFGELSGSGVAFKLAWAIARRVSGGERVTPPLREFLLDAVGLAALGLVADVVPLRDENRIYVRHGLARLAARPPVGVRALMAAAGLNGDTIRAEDVSFKLAPRLNAAGRLGCALLVVELLTTKSPARAKELAECLEGYNQQRQTIERRITQQARELVEANGYDSDPVIVLGSPDWHPGVVGIVAGRLAEQYARPVVLVALKPGDEVSTGSGRSVPGFELYAALRECTAELVGCGGHCAAAGVKVRPSRLVAFRERLNAQSAVRLPPGPPVPRLTLDAEIPLSALTLGLLRDLDRLEPYGAENPRPRFLAAGLRVDGTPRRIGGGERHLSFRVRQGGGSVRAVAFGMGERLDELMSAGGDCCLAFTPRVNEWQGYRSVEVEVVDLAAGRQPNLG